jgi:hypothetical protein
VFTALISGGKFELLIYRNNCDGEDGNYSEHGHDFQSIQQENVCYHQYRPNYYTSYFRH